ncbi:MAG: taurine dioxygenase [Alphaproteobacteria bacterium]|jgi:taurine dioxygenase
MTLTINPLSEYFGSEAHGVDLTHALPDEEVARLNQAFSERSVLVVRNQSLSPKEMLQAVQLFGDVFEQHNKKFSLPECPEIHYIWNQDKFPDGTRYIPGEGYHTDHSNDQTPPKATVLHAVKLPDSGGDTQFVNMAHAYEELDTRTKNQIADVQAVHVYQASRSTRKLMAVEGKNTAVMERSVTHPLVRTHPETGRKALYINPIRIESLVGVDDGEAPELLDRLLEHATQERFQYHHKWQPGDLVLWDNRCLLHKANGDYDHAQERYLLRVMLQGDKPY